MRLIFLFILIISSTFCFSEFESSHLPIVVIDTNGQQIQDSLRIIVSMGVIDNSEAQTNYITDPFNNYNGNISIEIRGSSSQSFPKKQYGFETQDDNGENLDVGLMGLPEENDWILYAPYSDKSLIRNAFTYDLAREMGNYASRFRFCELIIDEDYKGLYVLLEKIKRGSNRVNINKMDSEDNYGDALTGGFIFKKDKIEGNYTDGWYALPIPGEYNMYYQFHYPKPNTITAAQREYIITYFNEFEAFMASDEYNHPETGYDTIINVNSFINFYIINELSNNLDGYRLSTFLYKDRNSIDGRLNLGPVWDYNIAFGNADYHFGWETEGWEMEYNIANKPLWQRRIWEDPEFRDNFNIRWNQLRSTILSDENIDEMISALVDKIGDAQDRNFERWPILNEYIWPNYYIGAIYQNEVNYLKNWIHERAEWMDLHTQVDSLPPASPHLFINEFMASNSNTYADNQGDFDDWIEIYNPNDEAVNIGGYYLTDDFDNLTYWQIPENDIENTIIPPKGFVVLWADRECSYGSTHLNFKLSEEGEELGLIAPDGFSIIDSITFGKQTSEFSLGRSEDGSSLWQLFSEPTPGSSNCLEFPSDEDALFLQNHPDPFSIGTEISFTSCVDEEEVVLNIYNIKGQLVKSFSKQQYPNISSGVLYWDGKDEEERAVSSGVYICKLSTYGKAKFEKMLFLK
jgi:hypothetical protein